MIFRYLENFYIGFVKEKIGTNCSFQRAPINLHAETENKTHFVAFCRAKKNCVKKIDEKKNE